MSPCPPADPAYGQPRPEWFRKAAQFDQALGDRWQDLYPQTVWGQLDDWGQSPEGCLALILLFDQLPRNVFRDTPQAFATDAVARRWADICLRQDWDKMLLPVQRWFIYLPFEHSEDRADQDRAIAPRSLAKSED